MAIAAAVKTSNLSEVDGTIFNTASITMDASKLYLVSVASHGGPPARTVTPSGGSLTYTSVVSTTFSTIASAAKRIETFRVMPGSGTTTAITFTWSASVGHCHWSVDEFTGIDTSGTNGSGAIVQSLSDRSDSASGLTITLAGFGSTGNAAYGYFARAANENLTEGSGFTALGETTGTETPTTSCLSEWKLNDNTVDFTATSTGPLAGLAIEIKEATGGAPAVTRRTLLGVGV